MRGRGRGARGRGGSSGPSRGGSSAPSIADTAPNSNTGSSSSQVQTIKPPPETWVKYEKQPGTPELTQQDVYSAKISALLLQNYQSSIFYLKETKVGDKRNYYGSSALLGSLQNSFNNKIFPEELVDFEQYNQKRATIDEDEILASTFGDGMFNEEEDSSIPVTPLVDNNISNGVTSTPNLMNNITGNNAEEKNDEEEEEEEEEDEEEGYDSELLVDQEDGGDDSGTGSDGEGTL